MNDNASAEPQVNVAPQVFAEQVAILHRHSSLSLVTTAIATLLVVMLLYDAVPLAQTASWAAAMLATTALRGVIVQRYRAAAGQGRSTQTWMRDFCVGLSATSILWGVAAAAFLTTQSISARFGLLTILAVIPALSIPALGGHRVAFSLFVFPMLVPMAITLLRVGDHIHVALALATAVYGAVLWVMGRRAHQSTIESLTQRFDKEALLEQVITAREAAELARLGAEEARVAAEDANRAKSMFLATMSHEIRTPMNGVLGMNELLLRTELTTRQRHFADTVQRSGMQLLAIINDVLDFSKVEAGRLELEAVPIDLRQLADDVLGTYVELASRQGIALRSEMDPALAPSLRTPSAPLHT